MKLISFLLIWIVLSVMLNGCRSEYGMDEDGQLLTQTALAPTGTACSSRSEGDDIATDISNITPKPNNGITIEVDEIEAPQQTVIAFLNAVCGGDMDGAMDYWIPEGRDEGIRRLVAGWATGKHRYSVGKASYAGFFAPGDYRPLEADDPRVCEALVETWIDGERGSFALEKTGDGWLISGWLVADKL